MNELERTYTKKSNLRLLVFLIPWIFCCAVVIISLVNGEAFLAGMTAATDWILKNFAWLFTTSTFACVLLVILIYVSPFAKVRIGGRKAKPDMSYANVAWITLCTMIAAGILFWGCAEPMYQMYSPALRDGIEPGSLDAAFFTMKTMFLEWTITPYCVTTCAVILFAFTFYNMKKPYAVSSYLTPLLGDKISKHGKFIDIICLIGLVFGMASSLGTGTLTLAGGIQRVFDVKGGALIYGLIILAIVAVFLISSISGINKGIRILSSINVKVYIFILGFLLLFGPTVFMLNFAVESYGEFLRDFLPMSLYTGELFNDNWAAKWPIFYWCNNFAWTPITAIFLAKILRGYTVKDTIRINLFIPAGFITIWMGLFSTATIYYDMNGDNLRGMLLEQGPESLVYAIFDKLPLSGIIIPVYLFIVFISFVTASDSNTTAMSGICTKGITDISEEAPKWLKIVWGVTLGSVSWILISFAGIDGIKMASNLGGAAGMFLIVLIIISLFKVCSNPYKYDTFKDDYDEDHKPIASKRLPIDQIE